MLSGPYGIVVRRGASGRRKREQAPALHRNVAALDLECGASALRLLRLGRATARAACCAPTEVWYGEVRPGEESGSKLPHSTGTWRRLIWSAARAHSVCLGWAALRRAQHAAPLREIATARRAREKKAGA